MRKTMKEIKAKDKRHFRIRKRISGTKDCPRLAVFRSGKYIYAQLIDDEKGRTLVYVSDLKSKGKGTKSERALTVGQEIAKKAIALKIKRVVFDRGGFLYHGRVAELAKGAREGGLEF